MDTAKYAAQWVGLVLWLPYGFAKGVWTQRREIRDTLRGHR